MEWQTTSTILQRLHDQDDAGAWEHLVAHFRGPVVRFGERLGLAAADAEDVAQETLAALVAAYRDGRYEREKGRLRDWLFGIAYRQARGAQRKLAQRPAGGVTRLQELPGEGEATRLWEHEWHEALLERCLRRVAAEVQPSTLAAFRGVVLEGREAAAVAAELDMTENAVLVAKHRVLKRVRELRAELEDV